MMYVCNINRDYIEYHARVLIAKILIHSLTQRDVSIRFNFQSIRHDILREFVITFIFISTTEF